MEYKIQKIILILLVFALVACGRDELPLRKNRNEMSKTFSVDLGVDYSQVSAFRFQQAFSQLLPPFDSWNIAAGNRNGSFFIELNSALLMQFAQTEYSDIGLPLSIEDYNFLADLPQWDSDAHSFMEACLSGKVVIIHHGFDLEGRPKGYSKLYCKSRLNQVDFFLHSMEGTLLDSFSIQQSESPRYYAIDTRTFIPYLNINDFDLIFTRYTHVFEEPYMPYLVTGILSANSNIRFAMDTITDFSAITLSDTSQYSWSRDRTSIGYDWKQYSFNTQTFEILEGRTYLISTPDGWYYKLRFIDFYDLAGNKGHITFEYKVL